MNYKQFERGENFLSSNKKTTFLRCVYGRDIEIDIFNSYSKTYKKCGRPFEASLVCLMSCRW